LQIYKYLEVSVDKKAYVMDPGLIERDEKLLDESTIKRYGGISLRHFLLEKVGA